MYSINPYLKKMYCLRCGKEYPVADYYSGCPACAAEAHPVNLSMRYEGEQTIRTDERRLLRYQEFLPYVSFPSLGEGNTPVIETKRLADRFSLQAVYIKNEFQNPTGSHKDRMSPLAVARAVSLNKKCVVAASSGNAGASLAAYAAAAGIQCKIITTKKMNPIWKKAIELPGAELVIMNTPQERWPYMQKMVEQEDWYPVTNFVSPPVGSNPFGIQGYKTLAYELYEDFGDRIPAYILVPSCRADLLWGIFEGFHDLVNTGLLAQLPHLIAVEPFSRISRVLAGEDYRSTFKGDSSATVSIGGDTITYQAIAAIEHSRGGTADIEQREVAAYQQELAREGFYLESSAATILGALNQLTADKTIPQGARVLMVATSSGYKDVP
ncbi:threonine synthase [Acetonema longum]|uniref:Threonine synthase n=1 Tax=Acetonema longum DSM 6540 TaxID=1009370 RepID=F7NM35_9FIRM|nr:pyridoxal-phosphate dependent enzyme [Acetonema longum]EGO62890.1 threonine synthase [Acetonema longum DSM 6540]